MESSGMLLKVLGETNFESLNSEAKERLERHLDGIQNELDEQKAKTEKLRVDSEQRYFELETQVIAAKGQYDGENEKNQELNRLKTELEENLKNANEKIEENEKQIHQLTLEKNQLETTKTQLELEKKDLVQMLEKKSKETESLYEEWKTISDRISEANTAKVEALARVEAIESKEISAQYREQRLEQERDQLMKQNAWLEGELTTKTNELLNMRKDLSSRFLEVSSQLQEKTDEASHLQDMVDNLRAQNEDKENRMEGYLEKLKEARDAQMQFEEQFRQELQSQKKLVLLYKSSSEESDGKVKELLSAVAELQKIVHEASEATKRLEGEAEERDGDWSAQLKEKDETISKLKRELELSNDLISKKGIGVTLTDGEIESMSPSAAAASKLLKSGMTLTQIYSKYVEETEQLRVVKEENRQLNLYLEQIMQEIEEKAPLMKKQKEDYAAALQTINQLTSQLDNAMMEGERTRIELDENHRRVGHINRENKRLQQQSNDLGMQVKMLIKELEESRGTCVSTTKEDLNVSSGEVSSSSQLITEKLVTFRSIEELQEQNQKLLQVVRDLSDKQEEEEKMAIDSRTSALKKELDQALEELDEIRAARSRQAEMVESIVRQRDMYRVLLTQTGTPSVPSTPFHTSTPMPKTHVPQSPVQQSPGPETDKRLKEATEAIKDMQEELATYKKERAANEKVLNEHIDQAKQELSDLRVQNAKLASQLDFSVERFNVLQKNCESYKKEINAIRDKNQKYTASIVKHEKTINSLREDLMVAKEKLTRAEVQCQNLKAQLDIVKVTEARLQHEKESMHREQLSQNVLLANLHAIQNNLEKQEFQMKTKFDHQLEAKEKEAMTLRRQIAMAEGEIKAINRQRDSTVNNLEAKFRKEIDSHLKTKDELSDAYANVHVLSHKLHAAETKLSASESKIESLQRQQDPEKRLPEPEAENEELQDLKAQIDQASKEIISLKEQVASANKHVDQYKAIANSIEANLKEQNETSETFRVELEAKMETYKQENERLKNLSEGLEKERHDLLAENIRISEESHKLNAELRRQLASTQNVLEEAVKRREEAITNEQVARDDCQAQVKVASEAQDKYERELILHAADMEALVAVKKDLEGFNEQLNASQEEARKLKTTLESSKTAWDEQEKVLKNEKSKLETRYKELQHQNDTLHQQMEKLSSEIISIQQSKLTSLDVSLTEESQKSTEQLLEVVRFLRREKEIAETRSEYSTAESNRLKQKCDILQKTVDELNKNLAEERQSKQITLQTAVEHSDLMKKVENLNLLTDSNKMLREEKERLTQQVKDLETKIKKFEEDLLSMKEVNRNLTAHKTSVMADKTSLQGEVDRWKARVNAMIEQSNKTDPEERKRLVSEKEEYRKQVSQAREELHRVRAEQSKTNLTLNNSLKVKQNEINSIRHNLETKNSELFSHKQKLESQRQQLESQKQLLDSQNKKLDSQKPLLDSQKQQIDTQKQQLDTQRQQLDTQRQQIESQRQQVDKLLKEVTTKRTEVNEKEKTITDQNAKLDEANKTLTQLKKLGRKYRTQFEESTKEINELKAKLTQQQTQPATQPAGNDEQLKSVQETLASSQEKLKTAETELATSAGKLAAVEREKADALGKVQQLETALKSKTEEAEKVKAESGIQSADREKTASLLDKVNLELKQALTEKDKCKAESQQTKAGMEQAKAELEKTKSEMEQAKADLEKLKKENQDVKSKEEYAELERKQAHQLILIQGAKKRLTSQKEQIEKLTSENEEMKKKMSQSSDEGDAKFTAMKSTLEAKVSELESQVRSTNDTQKTEVAKFSKQLDDLKKENSELQAKIQQLNKELEEARQRLSQQETSAAQVERPTSSTGKTTPRANIQPISTPSPATSRQATSVQPVAGSSSIKATASIKPMAIATTPTPTATVMPTLQEQGSTSQVAEEIIDTPPVATVQGSPQEPGPSTSKRQREETETSDDTDREQQTTKRTKTTEAEAEALMEREEDELLDQQEEQDEIDVLATAEGDELEEEDAHEEEEAEGEEDDDEVIIVDSEDEEEEEDEIGEEEDSLEDDEDFEGDMGAEDFPEGTQAEEYESEGEGMEGDVYGEEMEGGVDEGEDSDDVVIVEEDDGAGDAPLNAGAQSTQPTAGSPDTQQAQVTGIRQIAPLPRLTGRAERLPSAGRAQLTPFSFGAQGSGFEDGDDCTVPSTPTLSLPKRADGFAEAVSSPQVPNARFVFGSGSDATQQSELGQLASQGALGMDDTKMDLSQFDEGSRVTVTSSLVGAPNIVITSDSQPSQEVELAPAGTSESGMTQEEARSEAVVLAESQSQEVAEAVSTISTIVSDQPTGSPADSAPGGHLGDSEEIGDPFDSFEGANRPRIQRIIWDQPVQRVQSQQGQAISSIVRGQSQPVIPQMRRGQPQMARRGMQQRGHPRGAMHRGAMPRGHGLRGTARRSRRPRGPQY